MIGNRAFTLPDMGGTTMGGANGFSLLHNDSKHMLDDHPIHFFAPELPAETLLDVSFWISWKFVIGFCLMFDLIIKAWSQWDLG